MTAIATKPPAGKYIASASRARLAEAIRGLTERVGAVETSLKREAEFESESDRLAKKLARDAERLNPLDPEAFSKHHGETQRATAIDAARARQAREREEILEPALRDFFQHEQIADVLREASTPLLEEQIAAASNLILPFCNGDRAHARQIARELPTNAAAAQFMQFSFCSVGDVAAARTAIAYLTALAEEKSFGPFSSSPRRD